MRRRLTDRGGFGRLAVAAGLASLVAIGSTVGTTSAQMTGAARASVASSTRAACASGTPYSTLLGTPTLTPSLWWRFGELTGATTVSDATGHGNTGNVVSTGLTIGTANTGLVSCDTTYSLRQPGTRTSTGFIATAAARVSPTTLTIATWVRTASLTGGRIVGFGDSRTGGSTLQDRALLLDRSGRAVFQVATTTGHVLVISPSSVATNTVHLIVATLSGTTAVLYVDGAVVATTVVALPLPPYAGYWRAGWDQNIAALIPTARNQANVTQDELAIWEGRALTGSEVASLWVGNHW